MSVIERLASSLGRRDEIPNQELAADIVAKNDKNAVKELIENLAARNKNIRHDCIKALYEIGYQKPALIAEYHPTFLALIDDKDNRMQWGGMTALSSIISEKPKEIFASLGKIIDAADRGSVITRDHCVKILVALSSNEEYNDKTFPLLNEQLMTCPINQVPMYSEYALPIITAGNKEKFIKTLYGRLEEIEKDSARKRFEKIIKKLG
jgi:hypothetical protein